MKLHRNIKHNENVCCTHDLVSYAQGQGCNQVRGQNLVSSLSQKTTEANITELQRKIEHNEKVCRAQEHNEKVCRAQELGSYAQGQGHDHVRGQIVPKIVLLINYGSKCDETSQKDKHNEKVCRAQDLGS